MKDMVAIFGQLIEVTHDVVFLVDQGWFEAGYL
jgi:hypothetical protein